MGGLKRPACGASSQKPQEAHVCPLISQPSHPSALPRPLSLKHIPHVSISLNVVASSSSPLGWITAQLPNHSLWFCCSLFMASSPHVSQITLPPPTTASQCLWSQTDSLPYPRRASITGPASISNLVLYSPPHHHALDTPTSELSTLQELVGPISPFSLRSWRDQQLHNMQSSAQRHFYLL